LRPTLYIASADGIKAMLPRLTGAVIWARDRDDRE